MSLGQTAMNTEKARLKCVIFDFDSTLSAPKYLHRFGKWAIADKIDVFLKMTPQEIISNFGGPQRIAELDTMLKTLRDRDTHLMIISLGRTECIISHLNSIQLLHYFQKEDIYGRDSDDLRKRKCGTLYCKASLILALMQRNHWDPHEVLFVDDSETHVQAARLGAMRTKEGVVLELKDPRHAPVCKTLLVADHDHSGMTQEEMRRVCAFLQQD